MLKKTFMFGAIFIFFFGLAYAENDTSVVIKKGAEKKISMAVSDFTFKKDSSLDPQIAKELTSILLEDLKAFNIFNLIENREFIRDNETADARSGTINFKEWSLLGANALVKANCYFEGNDLIIEGKLYDVNMSQLTVGKRYIGSQKSKRQMVHKLADEIYFRFTGLRGMAQTKIAFVAKYNGSKELFVMDFDGFNPVRLTADNSLVLSPDWTPDGKSVVYTTYRNGRPEIYAVDVNTGNPRALVTGGGLNSAPAWSPDGHRLALAASRDGNSEIYLFSPGGKSLTRLTNNSGIDTSPSWSPNGREIVFTSDRSGNPHLYIMDAEGTNARRLTYQGNYNDQAAWSPKGDRIAFSSRIGGKFDIFTIRVDGADLQQLTGNGGNNERPRWSPDGSQIIFSSTRTGAPQIWVMSSDGSNLRRLTDFKEGASGPSWSPRSID